MKISEHIKHLQGIMSEWGDIEICKKRTGAEVKMRASRIEYNVGEDLKVVKRYQGQTRNISVESLGGGYLEMTFQEHVRPMSEFEGEIVTDRQIEAMNESVRMSSEPPIVKCEIEE